MERELTPSESLQLIETMIGQAKQNYARISFYFLLWGTLLTLGMVFSLLARARYGALIQYENGVMLGLMALGAVLSFLYGRREGMRQHVSNPVSRAVAWLWMAFMITMACMMLAPLAGADRAGGNIVLLAGLPTFLTGIMLRFKPLMFGGIVFWVAGLALVIPADYDIRGAIFVAAMLFGYLIPGYLLKRQEDGLRTA